MKFAQIYEKSMEFLPVKKENQNLDQQLTSLPGFQRSLPNFVKIALKPPDVRCFAVALRSVSFFFPVSAREGKG